MATRVEKVVKGKMEQKMVDEDDDEAKITTECSRLPEEMESATVWGKWRWYIADTHALVITMDSITKMPDSDGLGGTKIVPNDKLKHEAFMKFIGEYNPPGSKENKETPMAIFFVWTTDVNPMMDSEIQNFLVKRNDKVAHFTWATQVIRYMPQRIEMSHRSLTMFTTGSEVVKHIAVTRILHCDKLNKFIEEVKGGVAGFKQIALERQIPDVLFVQTHKSTRIDMISDAFKKIVQGKEMLPFIITNNEAWGRDMCNEANEAIRMDKDAAGKGAGR